MSGPPDYVPYPRASSAGSYGPAPRRVRFDAISESWNLVKLDWGSWIGAVLILFAAAIVLEIPLFFFLFQKALASNGRMDATMRTDYLGLTAVSTVVIQFVLGILSAGMMNMGVKKMRREDATVGAMFAFNGMFGQLAAAEGLLALLALVPLFAGTAPFYMFRGDDILTLGMLQWAGQILGWLVVGTIQVFAVFVPLIILDQREQVGDAFRLSFTTIKPHFWPMAGLLIVVSIISGLGACACGVGLLFTMPLYYATKAILYNDFFRREHPAVMYESAPTL